MVQGLPNGLLQGGHGLPGTELVQETVDNICPDCWTSGCGCDAGYGKIADCLETINPFVEWIAHAIWCLGSPIAFPMIFCFDPSPHTNETSGWDIPAIQTPIRKPIECYCSTLCFPCGQYYVRRRALNGDMTKYKLWQGYHDGPHCFARGCPGAPITIKAGTYGEQDCPDLFLCLEVWLLAGLCSPCCAFGVSRRYMKENLDLSTDPTEARQEKCTAFFGTFMRGCWKMACCCCLASCLVGCCAPDSEGAQECSGEAGRASRACFSIAHTCWRGIISVRVLAIGCMSAQMIHESFLDHDMKAPKANKMEDRYSGGANDNNDNPPQKNPDFKEPLK